ncbi:hypothetical protein MINT15_07750 [Saccharomonospora viridis]|uniref:Uncharacterized protein n=1 Tax=Saccharomonospora viridis TaxID=1852 RepID=A0A837DF19_9PSEU|nr:hypothetical protein MINT15_07750 [Saccharomonospora viridis]
MPRVPGLWSPEVPSCVVCVVRVEVIAGSCLPPTTLRWCTAARRRG